MLPWVKTSVTHDFLLILRREYLIVAVVWEILVLRLGHATGVISIERRHALRKVTGLCRRACLRLLFLASSEDFVKWFRKY